RVVEEIDGLLARGLRVLRHMLGLDRDDREHRSESTWGRTGRPDRSCAELREFSLPTVGALQGRRRTCPLGDPNQVDRREGLRQILGAPGAPTRATVFELRLRREQ